MAKLMPYEIITKVAGEPISSPDAFQESIKKAREAGKKSVAVTILSMGKFRIADLDLKSEKD